MKKIIKFIKNNKGKIAIAVAAVLAVAGIKVSPETVEAILNFVASADTGAVQ